MAFALPVLYAVAFWIATAKTLVDKPKRAPIYARLYVNESVQQQHASQACSSYAGMGWISQYSEKMNQLCEAQSGSRSAFGCRRINAKRTLSLKREGPAVVGDYAYAQLNAQEQSYAIAHAKDKIISDDYVCSGNDLVASAEEAVGPRDNGQNFLIQFGVSCHWGQEVQLVEMYKHWVPLDFVQAEADACSKAAERVEALTFLMYPLDFWNPYEGGHQLLNTFATAVAMDIDMRNTRILWLTERMDDRGDAKLKGLAEEVFSRAGPALKPSQLQKGGTCLRNVVVPIGGMQSLFMRGLMNRTSWKVCPTGAPLVFGWGNYLLDVLQVERRDFKKPDMRITILTRMPGRREFANESELKHAVEHHAAALTMMKDVDDGAEEAFAEELVRALSTPGRIVKTARFDEMPIKEQLTIMQNTDLIISPHAAALTWMIVSPPCTRLLEMSYGPNHYQMISEMMNIPHTFTGGPLNLLMPMFAYGHKEINHMASLADTAEVAWKKCTGLLKRKLMRKEASNDAL